MTGTIATADAANETPTEISALESGLDANAR
jgi:hypothetical protein